MQPTALPARSHRAAISVALDTGNTTGIDNQLLIDTGVWEDVPMSFMVPGQEQHIDPSHEGGELFQFTEMAEATHSRS